MGATRKLQGEIDRVLKKVQEGVDVFDSIWNKVYDTENANQKEKFEADLKKEIKKLQRYRDQIKTWIQSSEIKDKKALLDARKLIEREMERFKVCEKETKTKAFSKEGLGQQPKTDPREKAKGESREWLNSMVSELESQIDSFEAEMEGLQVKKGKTRPPRLIHLEESISRHKKHIGKLEATLRLMDNDEVSPEQVVELKELVEDYVERNQENFEEFEDVEQVYEQLPLDNIEDSSNLDGAGIIPSIAILKEKMGTLAVSPPGPKSAMVSPGSQPQGPPSLQLPTEEVFVSEDSGVQTPPSQHAQLVASSPFPSLPGIAIGSSGQNSTPSTPTRVLMSGLSPGASVSRTAGKSSASVTGALPSKLKEEERNMLSDRRVPNDIGLARPQTISKVPSSGPPTTQMPPLNLGGTVSDSTVVPSNSFGSNPLVSDLTKRTGDDRFATGGLAQQLGVQNRAFLQTGAKLMDANIVGDGSSMGDGGLGSGRVNYPNSSWRQHSATIPFQAQTDVYHSRTKIAPDQKQEYVQRFHNQQGLGATGVQQLVQFPNTNQNKQQLQLLQMLQQQQQQQAAQQVGLPTSMQASQTTDIGITQKQLLVQSLPGVNSQNPPQQAHLSLGNSGSMKENDMSQGPEQQQGQLQELGDDANNDVTSVTSVFGRNLSLSDDDLKNSDTFNVQISGPGTLAELSQLSREVDFTTVQTPPQPSPSSIGIIGRRAELGAIGENVPPNHDQIYNLQMLETAYRNIPQLKDSERPRSYVPKNWVNVPASYPQSPAPILDNPSLWERLDTDVLFYAFYYQQETYHQYLAARELKKQSWRYHKKYNTWFQRHEEPKVTTDEYEQGTYVYFDFNIMHGDSSQGWCQRIKTEFTFEYSYLEDEIYV